MHAQADITSRGAERVVAVASPIAGAGMICPDTAYAALSPVAGRQKLHVAFGAYAGFKLLYPAGPLLVATGLGVIGPDGLGAELAMLGIALLVPLWAVSVLWAKLVGKVDRAEAINSGQATSHEPTAQVIRVFAPFGLLTALLLCGGLIGISGFGAIDFFLQPKGALWASAIFALRQTAAVQRLACWESAVRRTGSLLLVIGAASAFGAVLTRLVPIGDFAPVGSETATLVGLFALTVAFKLLQGASMATFAAVAPVAAPVVLASGAPPEAAVFAICLGSFVAILPNDSYYWLVRKDAFDDETSASQVIWTLAGGATLQALIGLALVLAVVTLL